ncbi:MAG: S-layer homology domain-containing protein, partial [Roseburia sp.]|nr:S-layer homology domain-containing protein [Roseburia sp.]
PNPLAKDGPIVLTPVYEKYLGTLKVNVTLNGSNAADGTQVTVTSSSGGAISVNGSSYSGTNPAGTASGTATFHGLPYAGYRATSTLDSNKDYAASSPNISASADGVINLNYVTYKFDGNKANAPGTATGKATGVPAGGTVMVNKAIAWPGKASLPGYTFLGWATSPTATSAAWTEGNSHTPTTAPTNGHTFYAVWSKNTLSLTAGAHATTYGVNVPAGTALNTKPTVTKPDSADTITYEVFTGASTWGNAHTIDGITLTANSATGAWTISGTPNRVGTGSVTFRIRVTSQLTGDTAENNVVVTIAKAKIDAVDVTDIKIPTPGEKPSDNNKADLPTDKGYGNNPDGGNGDESATVTWSPTDDPFKYGVSYTATVIVKPDENHEFASSVTTNATPETGGGSTVTRTNVSPNNNGTVTVTYTFPAVYQLVYSPNGGTLPAGGTQPAPVDVKIGDSVTAAADPNYERASYTGHHGWATSSGGGVAYNFGAAIAITQTLANSASNGVITLYYRWQSGSLDMEAVALDAVYGMAASEWQTGTVTYKTRKYNNLVAPCEIVMSGSSLNLAGITYTLTKNDNRFDPNTYFTVTKDPTTNKASLVMKSGETIPNVTGTSPYTFTVTATDGVATVSAEFTLNVRPIELDHAALAAVADPAAGAAPQTAVSKADTDTTWRTFYTNSAVSWAPSENPFKNGQSYTATITLTRQNTNYKFVVPDGNSTVTTDNFMVGTDEATNPATTGWGYSLNDSTVTLTRKYPLTGITVSATLTATAWNTLTVTGFTADTQSNVNLYYLIYNAPQTFADAAAVRAAYTAATAGAGGVIAKDSKTNVAPSGGTASWGSTVTVTDNGIVGDHTYYLYVVAEAVSDTSVLATNTDNDTTPKKLTLTHNGYGSVSWTQGSTSGGKKLNIPAGPLTADTLSGSYTAATANKSQVISMFQDSTFTATPAKTDRFGFVKWTLAPASGTAAADAGTANTYSYKASGTGANSNDETLHAIFHRKISGSFGITDDGAASGKTYTPNLTSVYVGDVAQTNQAGLSGNQTVTYQWYYGAASADANTDTGWTAIPGATGFTWKNSTDAYAGSAFRLKITYHDDANGGDSSWIAAKTGAQTQQLQTPQPDLELVETTVTDKEFPKMDGTNVDKKQGGLHMTLPIIAQDDQDGDPVEKYVVVLKKNGSQIDKFEIKPATEKAKDGNYYHDWPADLTNIKPDDTFTVEVQAIAKSGSGWTDSGTGNDTAKAGYRTLTREDLKGTFTDKRFNGTNQTGGTVTAPTGAGTVTVRYADTRPDADPSSKELNKLHVNIQGADGNIKPEYDVYVAVAKGTLYLEYPEALYTTANAATDNTDWKIYQSPVSMAIPTSTAQVGVSQTLTPTVTYVTGGGNPYGANSDTTGTITAHYDVTYTDIQVDGHPATASTDGGQTGDYIMVPNPTNSSIVTFTPLVNGTFTMKATASYKSDEKDQFKADLAEVTIDLTIGSKVRNVASIKLDKWDAVNGIVGGGGTVINPARTVPDEVVVYGNGVNDTPANDAEGRYLADTAANAKQMHMNGLRLTVTYDTGAVDVYVIGAANYDANGSTFPYNGNLPSGFEWVFGGNAAGTADKSGTNKDMTFSGAGNGTVAVRSGSKESNTVTYVMAKRPIDYTVESDAERTWNGSSEVSGHLVWELPANLAGDDVKLLTNPARLWTTNMKYSAWDGATPFGPDASYTTDHNVGKDKMVRYQKTGTSGSGSDVDGKDRAFYKRGTEIPGKATILPALVTSVDVYQGSPSASTVNNENLLSKPAYVPNTNTRTDENKVVTSAWELPVIERTWEAWDATLNDGAGGWKPVTDHFSIDTVYRATIKIRADRNHYLHSSVIDKYTINGKKAGEACIEDLDDWNNRPENVVTVSVDESGPFHSDWDPDSDKLYYNTATFTYIFHTYETPTLQFSDEKGGWTEEPKTGTDHTPSSYVHHDEVVQEGAGGMTYVITVNASVKDIFGAQVLLTNRELLDAGATLRVVQGNGDINVATPVNTDRNTPLYKVNSAEFQADQDLIIYELTVPSSLTASQGEYHLELQAMGSTSLANMEAGKVDVAKCYYTFTLIVQPNNPIGETALPIVTYLIGGNGYTNDLTAEKVSSVGARPTFKPEVTGLNGYVFQGWSETDPALLKDGEEPKLVDPLTFSISADKIFYAYYKKEGIDHTHYVVGYKDGTFRPSANITRAEVATIIARACLEGFEEGADYGNPGNYTDVGAKRWYA